MMHDLMNMESVSNIYGYSPAPLNPLSHEHDHQMSAEYQRAGQQQHQQFTWAAPDHLEVKTRSVEKTLEPLVMQITTLVSSKMEKRRGNKKGKSKRAKVLVAAVENAILNFVENGRIIASENPLIKEDMLAAVDEVMSCGQMMSKSSRDFATDPCSSAKRVGMVQAARTLLTAVTRLLIIADMIDVHILLKKLELVENDLERLKSVSSQTELTEYIKRFGISSRDLLEQTTLRQSELKDPVLRDELANARAVLKKHSTMLMTASKTYVTHPELTAAKGNRDFVLRQVCEAVNTISDVARGTLRTPMIFDGPGELAAALDDFDEMIIVNPLIYDESKTRPELEERLESIISGAALLADSSCTRVERRERIVNECNSVRQALQDLLTEYASNAGMKPTQQLDIGIEHMCKKTRDLRRQMRKAVVDHISDTFISSMYDPLHAMIEVAANSSSDIEQLEAAIANFVEYSKRCVDVANLACSMAGSRASSSEAPLEDDRVKMVRYAADQIQNLSHQVVNAVRILAARPKSKVAQDNIEVFQDVWKNQIAILIEAVDDITTVEDFLAVSENHILEDVNKCVDAMKTRNVQDLDKASDAIKGRSSRICGVVTSEMDNYEPGLYTERVLEAIRLLGDGMMPNFSQKVDNVKTVLNSELEEGSMADRSIDENEFIEATRLVYDGVREIRHAVLLNRGIYDDGDRYSLGSDFTTDDDNLTVDSSTSTKMVSSSNPNVQNKGRSESVASGIDEYPDIHGISNARDAMQKLPAADREKIARQVEVFRDEKRKFDMEVSKWDDNGNDVIVLAKHMCTIMIQMTDFTRGRGPLQTTLAVIDAAKRISEAGTKLDNLARAIADQCPESSTKKDLIAYLQRIALYCHQLNITSKVKADVQNVSGELIVSGLDSATSLIQAAKNLMNAVVLTVKASYVASTKYYPKQNSMSGGTNGSQHKWSVGSQMMSPASNITGGGGISAIKASMKPRSASVMASSSPAVGAANASTAMVEAIDDIGATMGAVNNSDEGGEDEGDGNGPLVIWKMKVPEKKPLVRRENSDEVKVKRGSFKHASNPAKALQEFQGLDNI